MDTSSLRNSNATIVVTGILLSLVLAALVGSTYVGQTRLHEALVEQEQLGIDKKAESIAFFLAQHRDAVEQLAQSRPLAMYLADRERGMSMQNGLRLSLMAVTREFEYFIGSSGDRGRAVFQRIAFVEENGHLLLDVGRGSNGNTEQSYQVLRTTTGAGEVRVRQGNEGAVLTLSAPVIRNGRAAGYVIADLPVVESLSPLLRDHKAGSPIRRTALITNAGTVLAAADGEDWNGWRTTADKAGEAVLEAGVKGTDFFVVTLPGDAINHSVVTSPWFVVALSLICAAVLSGVAFLLRLNNRNLVLRTHFEATAQQRMTLHEQNERLQREIDKRLESEQKLVHQANYDQLTGLPNRNLAMDRLAQAIKWAKRESGSVLTMFLDLDRFKQVNDSLGHSAGDELLREAAQRLESRVRESDTVSRLGGDEFLVICPDVSPDGDWEHIAQEMLKAMSAPFYIGDHEFFVGASIGVAAYPDGGNEPQKLLKNADIAMYAAKEKGRNRYCYYDPSMDALAIEELKLENNLRHALARREFHLAFQPIVDLSSGRTVAVEALLRWTNAEMGDVPPDRFIPIAEETGLIHEIGEWVLSEACRVISGLQPEHTFRIAVNLSSKQFSRPGRLLDCVLHSLRSSGLMPSQLELEITESILIDDRPETGSLIDQLDRIGVRLSIDDFGTGYSALNYLQRFPFDVLKIDRNFTRQAPESDANASLIRAIIAMAHALGLEVVAEGIESREQAGFLLVHHCGMGQGYLYSRPLTSAQLRDYLADEYAISA